LTSQVSFDGFARDTTNHVPPFLLYIRCTSALYFPQVMSFFCHGSMFCAQGFSAQDFFVFVTFFPAYFQHAAAFPYPPSSKTTLLFTASTLSIDLRQFGGNARICPPCFTLLLLPHPTAVSLICATPPGTDF